MSDRSAVNTQVDRKVWNTVRKGVEFCNSRIDRYLEEVLVEFYEDKKIQEELFEAFKEGIEIDKGRKGKKKINIELSKTRCNFLKRASAIEEFSVSDYVSKIIGEFFEVYYDEIIDSFYDNFIVEEEGSFVFSKEDLEKELGETETLSTVVNEECWAGVRKMAFLYEIEISKLLDLIILWYSREYQEEIRSKMGVGMFE